MADKVSRILKNDSFINLTIMDILNLKEEIERLSQDLKNKETEIQKLIEDRNASGLVTTKFKVTIQKKEIKRYDKNLLVRYLVENSKYDILYYDTEKIKEIYDTIPEACKKESTTKKSILIEDIKK